MDREILGDDELAGVSGGADAADFSRVADSCAWKYGCGNCPNRNIYSARGMCAEVYYELLTNYSNNQPMAERCNRRN